MHWENRHVQKINNYAVHIIDYDCTKKIGGGEGAVYHVNEIITNGIETRVKMKALKKTSSVESKNNPLRCKYSQEIMQTLFSGKICKQLVKTRVVGDLLLMPIYKQDLATYLQKLKETQIFLPRERLLSIMENCIKGLFYLHVKKEMCHRDIKPENYLMKDDDQFLLTDFGLAVAKNFTNVNLFVDDTSNSMFLIDKFEKLKWILEAKKHHQTNAEGFEPKSA